LKNEESFQKGKLKRAKFRLKKKFNSSEKRYLPEKLSLLFTKIERKIMRIRFEEKRTKDLLRFFPV